jgi:hypothetical protein
MGEEKRRRHYEAQRPEQRLGDAPLEAQYHEKMVAIAQTLDELFNGKVGGPGRETGFVLMVFPFDEVAPGGQGRCNYISNGADRRDIVTLMREMIARFEGQPEAKGRA